MRSNVHMTHLKARANVCSEKAKRFCKYCGLMSLMMAPRATQKEEQMLYAIP